MELDDDASVTRVKPRGMLNPRVSNSRLTNPPTDLTRSIGDSGLYPSGTLACTLLKGLGQADHARSHCSGLEGLPGPRLPNDGSLSLIPVY